MLTGVIVAAMSLAVLQADQAVADTAPLPPVTTSTVTADALPTVQVNGVVWNQIIVNNVVYATGAFTSARPSGSAAGSNETPRSNILAYNLTTGALITTWAPTLNAQGLALAASPDGTRIYVGGDFTSVSGVARNRIVALNATTGAVITTFQASVNNRVRSLVATADTVYASGTFTSAQSMARSRLAAFATSNGLLTTWAPVADNEVMAITMPAGSGKIVAGGRFGNLAGVPAFGMGAVDATTGAPLPWAANTIVKNMGSDAAIYSLSSDANNVYGTGYTYLVNPGDQNDGNFEDTFEATAASGALVWVNGCRGDTYSSAPVNGVLYYTGHSHDCSAVGGNPQTDPWTYQRASAEQIAPAADGRVNNGGNFNGLPAPELLTWRPDFNTGSYTGQGQAAWSVAGNSQYVVVGGEFPRVNNADQQGLTRFAVTSIAPNKQGPQGTADLTPTLLSLQAGRVRISWKAAWDRDNRNLTYEVLRGSGIATATPIATLSHDSEWYNRPNLFASDPTAPAGTTQTYRIRVHDAFNNVVTGPSATIVVPTGGTTSQYADQVIGDGAAHFWRLGEPSGSSAYDYVAADDLAVDSSATRGADGAMVNDSSAKSTTFAGTAAVPAVSPSAIPAPQSFSEEAWFNTTSTTGGKIIGFGNSNTGDSSGYDRHIYMTNDGKIVFGLYPGGVRTVSSPLAYNDGQWHQVVANLGSAGMELYLDGKRVGRDTSVTSGQVFSGYWRIGGDNIGGWPNQPGNSKFTGGIEDVAVYPAPLTLSQVQSHYQASGRTLNLPTRPTDAYGAAVWDAGASLYWRLDDAQASSTALDRITNNPASGTYSAGVVKGEDGAPAQPGGTSIRLPGDSSQALVSSTQVSNPTVFSLETWFKTTTTHGGRLIGFGDQPSGNSSNYDRHVYMLSSGQLRYGIYDGNTETIDSPTAYNDGQWHLVVATQGANGQQLFVDGALVATGAAVTPQNYSGYWRLGSDNIWSGADTSNFAGSLDEAAVYDTVLSSPTVSQHYQLGKPAAVNQPPTAAFSSTSTALKASFDASASTDPDGTIASYSWQFGDGGTATGVSPDHTYAASGDYDVALTVKDDSGATATKTHTVTVTQPPNQLPTATFSATKQKLKVSFDATGSNDPDGTISSYAWNFGDGSNGSGSTTSHTYSVSGTYTVGLTVTDNRGGATLFTDTVTVAANAAPSAAFSNVCTNLNCDFDATASNDSDGTVASYSWDFGDGSAAGTGMKPSHSYLSAGSRTVVLTVTDNDGATNSTSSTVVVTAANVSPTAVLSSSCTALVCDFDASGSTDSDGTIASYSWDLGDGASSNQQHPSHTYAHAGDFTVVLKVTDNDGATATDSKVVSVTVPNQKPTAKFTPTCTDLSCAFDSAGSTDPDGTIMTLTWDFGDGSSGTGPSPTHLYTAGTYTVKLTVTDNDGATDSVTHSVTAAVPANQAPKASFSSTCTHLDCTFSAAGSTDADGTITSYAWTFGDTSTGTGQTPTHSYTAAGSYDVKLTVTDNDGASDSQTKTVVVTAAPANTPPTASFTASCTNLNCTFNGSGSTDPGGSIAGYAWTFGDGASAVGVSPAHSYPAAGAYTVILTVTDNENATASTSRVVTVTAAQTGAAFAADAFGRTVATGLGSADTGGAWTIAGGAGISVADGSARFSVPSGQTGLGRLAGVSNLNTDLTTLVWLEGAPTGGGVYVGSNLRASSSGMYRARLKILPTGAISAQFTRVSGASTETALGTAVAVPGTYTSGTKLHLRAQSEGSSPTTLRMKVWVDGSAEPSGWTVTTTDSTSGYQTAAGVGLSGYQSGTATAPQIVRFDDLNAVLVGAAPVNQAPVAAFTSSTANLVASVNATGSTDSDGTIASYGWNFGDGQTGSGSTLSHTYQTAGTYSVVLTVTDNGGATNAVTKSVTVAPPANQAPAAAFTSTAVNLTASFNGSGSTDPDGTVAGYAWNFGDSSAAGTGATPSHTYPAAGTYSVTLTVTDNGGATNAVTKAVAVTAPAGTALAQDAFTRTVATGLGSATTGGAWTASGSSVGYSVTGTDARFSIPISKGAGARLNGVSSSATDLVTTAWLDAMPTGAGAYVGSTVRSTAAGDYRVRLLIPANGVVTAQLTELVGSTETIKASQVVSGLTYTAGTKLILRGEAFGTSPTTLRMKVWAAGTSEPTAWRLTFSDSTTGLQVAGSVGLDGYVSGTSTAAVVVHYDDLAATPL